jgi:hypothetical protein
MAPRRAVSGEDCPTVSPRHACDTLCGHGGAHRCAGGVVARAKPKEGINITKALTSPSPLLGPSKPFHCYLHPLKPSASHIISWTNVKLPFWSSIAILSMSKPYSNNVHLTWLHLLLIIYLDQHQYGQANSWFLIFLSLWLDILESKHSLKYLYLHTSDLIKSIHSDFQIIIYKIKLI